MLSPRQYPELLDTKIPLYILLSLTKMVPRAYTRQGFATLLPRVPANACLDKETRATRLGTTATHSLSPLIPDTFKFTLSGYDV